MGCSPHRHNQGAVLFWTPHAEVSENLLPQNTHMAETIKKWDHRQNIGGVFALRENADKAIQAFRDLGVPDQDIHEVVSLYDTVRAGKILVTVHNVKDPAPIMEIFDNHQAEYNLDGSRNFRQDVAGLTVGTAAGATAGAVTGTFVAGPLGTAVGAATGAVVGGGLGSVIGKAKEHLK